MHAHLEHELTINFRPAQAGDYPALIDLYNSQSPFKTTAERLLAADARSATQDRHFRRIIAENADRMVGSGEIRSLWGDAVQPGRYWVSAHLDETARNPELFSRLLNYLTDGVMAEVSELAACIREDYLPHAGFLEAGGFEERFRSWGAHLDLTSFDPSQFAETISELEAEGFRFIPFSELSTLDNIDRLQALQAAVSEDVLSFEPIVPSGLQDLLEDEYVPEGLIVAVSPDGQFIGLSTLKRTPQPGAMDTGLTGVIRRYRGRGIATAVKVRALLAAQNLGAIEIGTGGGGVDSPMKRLNQKLGFNVGPQWVTLISTR